MLRPRLALVFGLVWLAACGQFAAATPTPPPPTRAADTATPVFMTDTPAPTPTFVTATPSPTAAARPAGTELPDVQPLTPANAAGLTLLGQWASLADAPSALAFTSSGRSLWASAFGRVWAWRARDGVLVRSAANVALSPDGQFVVETFGVSTGEASQAQQLVYVLRDTGNNTEVTRWTDTKPIDVSGCRPGECAALRFSPDAERLAEIEDLAPGQRVPVLKVWRRDGTLIFTAQGAQAFTFSVDGMLLVTQHATEPPLNLWRAADGALLKSIAPGFAPTAAVFSPDSGRLAVAGAGRVQVWRWGEGTLEREWPADVVSLAFNADGSLLAAGSAAGLRLWSVADGQELPAPATAGGNGQLALAPDGSRLAVVIGQTVEIWGVPAGFQP